MKKEDVVEIGNEKIDLNSPFALHAGLVMGTLLKTGVEKKDFKPMAAVIQSTIAKVTHCKTLGMFAMNFTMVYVLLLDNHLACVDHHDKKLADENLKYLFKTYKRLCDDRGLLDENGNLKE